MLKSAETLKPIKDPKACLGTLVILQRGFMEMLAATSATSRCSRRQRRLKRFSNSTSNGCLDTEAVDVQCRSNMFVCKLAIKTNAIALAHSSEDLLLEAAKRSLRALYERGRLSMPLDLVFAATESGESNKQIHDDFSFQYYINLPSSRAIGLSPYRTIPVCVV